MISGGGSGAMWRAYHTAVVCLVILFTGALVSCLGPWTRFGCHAVMLTS
jgi:hypothetical protein